MQDLPLETAAEFVGRARRSGAAAEVVSFFDKATFTATHLVIDPATRCWIWQGAYGSTGYPIMKSPGVKGGCLLVRRVVVELDSRPAKPRQPAWAAATRRPSALVNSTGKQSATITVQARPGWSVRQASATVPSGVEASSATTWVPWTWFKKTGFEPTHC